MTDLLAFVDGSIYSQSVCDHAAWAAQRLDLPVTIAHVLGHRQGVKSDLSGNIGLGARTALLEELAELDQARARLGQKRGRAILEDARTRILDQLDEGRELQVDTRLRQGDFVETLAEMEAGADLVLIGKRGEAADFAKLHLGSNLERVIRSSRKPILVCARAFRPITRLLVAFDGGPSAMKAVDFMSRSPLFAGLSCTVLTTGAETTEARRRAEGAAAQLRGGGLDAASEIIPGQPEDVIAGRINDGAADLVVMGAYSHTRLRGMIVGSTTTELIRSCKIPLLLFR